MSFWNGTHWLAAEPAPARTPRRGARRLGGAMGVGLVMLLVLTGVAMAGKGNRNGHHSATATASCVLDGGAVTATGLPTGEVLNFMVTDPRGTWGWVLGFTDTGNWVEPVPAPAGPTTYEFASRTWGPNGSHYRVFASCSAG